jgi:curved DNA-binding protein CbpA
MVAPNFVSLYAILGLNHSPKPSADEIRKAYLAKALELHPDKNPNDPQATAKFQNLNKAYDTVLQGYVTIEEDLEQDIATAYDSENENQDDAPDFLNLPRRQRKAYEEERRKIINGRRNHVCRGGRVLSETKRIQKEGQEDRELQELERKIEKFEKRIENGSIYEEDNVLSLATFRHWHERMLVPTQGQRIGRCRKPLRSELNTEDLEHALDMAKAMTDVRRDWEEEKKDDEFRVLHLPMEHVPPSEKEEMERIRNHICPCLLATEEEENEKARVLREKVNSFWDCSKASEQLKTSNVVHFVPKRERDPKEDVFQAASVAYTKQCLDAVQQDEAMIEALGALAATSQDLCQEPIPSNNNLSLDHHVASRCRREKFIQHEDNSEDENENEVDDDEYRTNELERMRKRLTRKIAWENSLLYSDDWF